MGRINTIDRRADVVFLLLHYTEGIRGITKLQKLLFLIEQETEFFKAYGDVVAFEFAPYKMGPFSEHVYEEVEFLIALNALTTKPLETTPICSTESELTGKAFSLTPKGQKIAAELATQLEPRYQTELEEFASEYNERSLRDLLQYVYATYPAYATKSEIIDIVGVNVAPTDEE